MFWPFLRKKNRRVSRIKYTNTIHPSNVIQFPFTALISVSACKIIFSLIHERVLNAVKVPRSYIKELHCSLLWFNK